MGPVDVRPRAGWRWSVAVVLSGLAVAAWWVYPIVHPLGLYAGCYRLVDIELGGVGALVWLALVAVRACPRRVRRPVGVRVTVALAASLVSLAACDLAYLAWCVGTGAGGLFQLRSAATIDDPELRWKHRPGLTWNGRKTPDCQAIEFRTDENGFRNPPGVYQADIVFVGDSITEAGEVRDEVSFARATAARLGMTAANLGVFSYGPQQELAVLKRYGLAYRPRTVVWQVTEWNDLTDAERYRFRLPPPLPSQTWFALYQTHSPVVKVIRALFPPHGKFLVDFRRSDGAVDRRTVRPCCDFVRGHEIGLEETRRALAEAHALCRERGVAFVVLYVPDHPRVLAPYVVTHGAWEERDYRPAGGLDRPDDLAHRLADECRKLGCAFLDVTPDLRTRAARDNRHVYVKSDTHLDVDGHDEVTRVLAAHLRSVAASASAPARPASERR